MPPKAKATAADTNGQAPASPEPPHTARRPRAASAGPKATGKAAREAVTSSQAEVAPDASPTDGAASDAASPRPAKKTAKTSTAARRASGKTAAASAQEAADSDGADAAAATPTTPTTPSTDSGAPAGAGAGKRSNRTFYLPDELYSRGRNAVAWTSLVPGEAGSYAALTERALRAEVERLEKVYNDGEPFEDAQLKRGPAAGVMERVHALRAKARQAQEGES